MSLLRCRISPDADDLFMFRALLLGLVDTEGLDFDISSDHTDALNRLASGGDVDLCAVSIAWYPSLARRWQLMSNGGSVGRGYGPVVVAPEAGPLEALRGRRIAVPGLTTTAYVVLRLMLDFEPVVVPITPPDAVFEEIEARHVDAALLIHEGRLTFGERGLFQVTDIGAQWAALTGLPLPLGGNVIRRSLGPQLIARATRVVGRSIAHGLAHRDEAIAWLLERGGALRSAAAVDHYLSLYANADTLDYGADGRRAIAVLLQRAEAAGLVEPVGDVDFS